MKIQLSAIKLSKSRIRRKWDDKSIDELAQSIKEQGLLVPIKVRPVDNGYELVYGHRRAEAMKRLGWTETDALIDGLDNVTALLQQIIENEVREDVPYRERAEGYERALREADSTVAELSRRTGISQSRISDAVHWLEEFRAGAAVTVDEGSELGPKDAGVVRTLEIRRALGDDLEAKKAVARKVADEGLSRFQARALAEAVAATPDAMTRAEILNRPYIPDLGGLGRRSSIPSKPFHTSERPISDQLHGKLIWNLRRIDLASYSHFTIGYSQRSMEQIVELLGLANVNMLVDARRNPVSQYRPEFSKTSLESSVNSTGVMYRHIPELGIDAEDRADLAETHDYDLLFSAYTERLSESEFRHLLGDDLQSRRIAFLCVELDPNSCHRHRIALLIENLGFSTLDL